MEFVVALHTLAAACLAIYALHEGMLLVLFLRRARQPPPAQPLQHALPRVTVQLPMFNEPRVAGRVIRAACGLNYPRDRVQIQVLDDSTDETAAIAARACAEACAAGHDIQYLHRTTRAGYKAGALRSGLQTATGEWIAIFDADFVPHADTLRALLAHAMQAGDRLAFVQARWDFLNRNHGLLQRAQGMMLDMHFVIEQPARSDRGLLFNFNGSAGIWRRACIDAIGWQDDTLAEDLDLSYRARLAGWAARYCETVTTQCELTDRFDEFKRQQARWARGSAQNFRKLLRPIAGSSQPIHAKLAGLLHISGYLLHAWLCVLAVTTSLLAVLQAQMPLALTALGLCGTLPILTMIVAHRARGGTWTDLLRALPLAAMFGIGLSVSNAAGWLKGFFSRTVGEWQPTPKGGHATMPGRHGMVEAFELALAALTGFASMFCLWTGNWLAAANTTIYCIGFAGVWLAGLRERQGAR